MAAALDEAIARILDRRLRPEPAPTEADWYERWMSRALGSDAPIVTAVIGGALADRLPWVFVAGYQAANRRAFPELASAAGWLCMAASEDREGKLPGTSLEDVDGALRLSGTKTWIAASDHVDRLVVTVGRDEGQRTVVVDRRADGVAIETYDRASFLGDLTQGRATFEGAPILEELSAVPGGRGFGAAEPLHVLTALNAFMLSHTLALAGPASLIGRTLSSIHAAAQLSEHPLTSDLVPYGLAGIDAHTQVAAEHFEALIAELEPQLHARWLTDRRLVGMFSASISRHAEALADRTLTG